MSLARRAAAGMLAAGRAAAALLPARARRALEDRFFYAVFNVTRVTNDAYGWRPAEDRDAGPEGEADDPGGEADDPEGDGGQVAG